MAAYDRYTAVGAREDLTDVIYDISPTDTPIMSSIGKTKATSVYHEWQTDSLAAATTSNALVEGNCSHGSRPVASAMAMQAALSRSEIEVNCSTVGGPPH